MYAPNDSMLKYVICLDVHRHTDFNILFVVYVCAETARSEIWAVEVKGVDGWVCSNREVCTYVHMIVKMFPFSYENQQQIFFKCSDFRFQIKLYDY